MKRFHISISLVCIILLSTLQVEAQSKYDKMLKDSETNYEAGNYSKAMSTLAKFKKKAFKKLGQQNGYTPTYYMLLAKYNLASGYIVEFESNLQVALNSSKGIDKENSQAYGVKLIEAAELHNLNGSYRVAREYLEQARKVLDDGGFMKDAVKGQYSLAMSEALTGQGYYTEAIELLQEQERYCPY